MTTFSLRTFFGQHTLNNVGEKRAELRLYVGLLLAADAILILLHLGNCFAPSLGFSNSLLTDPRFALNFNGGYGEVFNFAQLFILIGILFRTGLWTKQPVYLWWTVIYFYVLIDDSFNIHGYLGSLIAPSLQSTDFLGLTPQHTGEILSWLAIGIFAAAGLLQANWHTEPQHRQICKPLFWAFGLLLFFAVGVDALQQISAPMRPVAYGLWSMVEEGGEMIAVTLTVGAAIVLSRKAALAVKPEST